MGSFSPACHTSFPFAVRGSCNRVDKSRDAVSFVECYSKCWTLAGVKTLLTCVPEKHCRGGVTGGRIK